MRIELVTAPTTEPVTLAEARAYLRVTSTSEDDTIGVLLAAARYQVEEVTGYALGVQTRRLVLDAWPRGWGGARPWHLPLPRPPLHSVTSVKYLDAAGDLQTWDDASYTVETSGTPGAICLGSVAGAWPANYWHPGLRGARPGCLQVEYVCGFGAGAEAVPPTLKLAVLSLVSHWYENRTPVEVGTIASKVPNTFEFLTAGYRYRYRPDL